MRAALRSARALSTLALLAASGCDINFFVCDVADDSTIAALPTTLAATGLDGPDVLEYVPQFELWSDGADKQRWFLLPPGARIDAADQDSWLFPVGTSVWKRFSVDGQPIETRLLRKLGPGIRDWGAVSYVHQDDGSAIAEPLGRLGARGTQHNVPAAGECAGCHGGRASWVLGLSAIQLAYDDQRDDTVELDDLSARGLLTAGPTSSLEIPGNSTERAALGYLHANCGHCHNSDRPPRASSRCFEPKNDLDFWLRAETLGTPQTTPTYVTAVGSVVVAGNPDASELLDRVDRRGFIYQMPPLGSEVIDRQAVETLRAWVSQL